MERYHIIKSALGGSTVYDSAGNQVGYSLPGLLGGGEDFFDMEGNPVGQSFEDGTGGASFIGVGNGSAGFLDEEFMMGRNAYIEGDPFGNGGNDPF